MKRRRIQKCVERSRQSKLVVTRGNLITKSLARICLRNEKYAEKCWSLIQELVVFYQKVDPRDRDPTTGFIKQCLRKYGKQRLPPLEYKNEEHRKTIREYLLNEGVHTLKYITILEHIEFEDKDTILNESNLTLCDIFDPESHITQFILSKLLNKKNNIYDKRQFEIEGLTNMTRSQESVDICNVTVPMDVIIHICEYIPKGKETLDTLGGGSICIYTSLLLTWEYVYINARNIYNIPVHVLSNVKRVAVYNNLDLPMVKYLDGILKDNTKFVELMIDKSPNSLIDMFRGPFKKLEMLHFLHRPVPESEINENMFGVVDNTTNDQTRPFEQQQQQQHLDTQVKVKFPSLMTFYTNVVGFKNNDSVFINSLSDILLDGLVTLATVKVLLQGEINYSVKTLQFFYVSDTKGSIQQIFESLSVFNNLESLYITLNGGCTFSEFLKVLRNSDFQKTKFPKNLKSITIDGFIMGTQEIRLHSQNNKWSDKDVVRVNVLESDFQSLYSEAFIQRARLKIIEDSYIVLLKGILIKKEDHNKIKLRLIRKLCNETRRCECKKRYFEYM